MSVLYVHGASQFPYLTMGCDNLLWLFVSALPGRSLELAIMVDAVIELVLRKL